MAFLLVYSDILIRSTKMKITDWFNVKDINHLKAYQHLQKTGNWPKDFLPSNIESPQLWQVELAVKLANAYVSEQIKS